MTTDPKALKTYRIFENEAETTNKPPKLLKWDNNFEPRGISRTIKELLTMLFSDQLKMVLTFPPLILLMDQFPNL